MQFKKTSALLLAMGLFSMGTAQAADQGGGTVTFSGSLIEAPCSVDPDSKDLNVPMGQVTTAALKSQGTAAPVRFEIKLNDCQNMTQKVKVKFTGIADSKDPKLLGLQDGTAEGAGIKLMNDNGSQIDLNTGLSSEVSLTPTTIISLQAALKGSGTDAELKAGDFTSVANFALQYN